MKQVMLTFDVEEFDTPLEYNADLLFQQQIEVSSKGTKIILDFLKETDIHATFFCTVIFANHAPDLVAKICHDGHELASHGYFHSKWDNNHLLDSREELQRISGNQVKGFRMARMMPVDEMDVQKAGYSYNSSLNPTYLPGRYNNFFKPRTVYKSGEIFQVPASVSPLVRIPLFWLSFHNLPLWLYKALLSWTINIDQYVNMYFHPWEFAELSKSEYNLPRFISRNSGAKMLDRFSDLILWMKKRNYQFVTLNDFLIGQR